MQGEEVLMTLMWCVCVFQWEVPEGRFHTEPFLLALHVPERLCVCVCVCKSDGVGVLLIFLSPPLPKALPVCEQKLEADCNSCVYVWVGTI